jgi:hypothetical protein
MKLVHATLVATLLLAGCATSPKNIEASYVSPVPYQSMTCNQLRAEAQRVSYAAAKATGKQSDQAGKDAVAMGVTLVVFWPAVFFIGGDKTNAAEVANLKGQMNAIADVNQAKNCGIQFQQG